MKKSEHSLYTPLDLAQWREAKSLVLTPKFQRRSVWSTGNRSYFIDSLIRGMPIPPLYLREIQSADKKRIVREVVDGQQRIAAILDYLDDTYGISRTMDPSYAGKRFSELSQDQQDAVRQYALSFEIFRGISDAEVLEVFARLNTYSVQLNRQELRNGRYFGHFKQAAYRLAYDHLEFWRRHGLFTERSIARMSEVELVSELMIAEMAGLQDKKNTIDKFYKDNDEKFPERDRVTSRFERTIDAIQSSVGDRLRDSAFTSIPLFYSLFCVVFHRMFGLPGQRAETPTRPLDQTDRTHLADAVLRLSDVINAYREDRTAAAEYAGFVVACLQQTDNIQPRQIRFGTIYREAFQE